MLGVRMTVCGVPACRMELGLEENRGREPPFLFLPQPYKYSAIQIKYSFLSDKLLAF